MQIRENSIDLCAGQPNRYLYVKFFPKYLQKVLIGWAHGIFQVGTERLLLAFPIWIAA